MPNDQTAVHAVIGQVATYFNSAGQTAKPAKVFAQIVPATSSLGQVIDISSAEFTAIRLVSVTVQAQTNNPTQMPFASVKEYTNRSITVNAVVGNSALPVIGQTLNGLLIAPAAALTGAFYHVLVLGD